MITLYDADRCPYCARVRIVLAEKSVPYDTVVIDLADRPAWLYEKNPLGRFPCSRRTALHPRVGGDHGAARGALPRAAALSGGPGPAGARAACCLALRRRVHPRLLRGAARRRRRRRALWVTTGCTREASHRAALHRRAELHPRRHRVVPVAAAGRGLSRSPASRRYPAIAAWLDRLAERPAIVAEIEVVASLTA